MAPPESGGQSTNELCPIPAACPATDGLRITAEGTRQIREEWADVMRVVLATAPTYAATSPKQILGLRISR